MKTISIINQKGGVGKTTTALAIGAGLLLKGYKVLFVDMDAQGNLTNTLQPKASIDILSILENPGKIKELPKNDGEAAVITSTPSLAGADKIIDGTGKEYKLSEALANVRGLYDFIIIDTPPALSILTVNALTASDGVIIPTQADIYSLQGIGQLNNTIEAVKKYCNPSLNILGLLITRYNKRATIRREIAEALEATAKQLNTKVYTAKIRECVSIVEAQAVKKTIFDYAPKSNAALDYIELVEEIIKDERKRKQ